MLIGERSEVLSRIQPADLTKLQFTIDASRKGVDTYKWDKLTLVPFYSIHHSRYMCYWYQQTAENFANSSMAKTEAENEALLARTLDFVAPGEQQSEAGHDVKYSNGSTKGTYNGESYRDAQSGGYVQYTLFNNNGVADSLAIMCRFTVADKGRKASLLVDGVKIADIVIPESVKKADSNGFYNVEYPIPASLITDGNGQVKKSFVLRLAATQGTLNPGLYYLRLMKGYVENADAYHFRASDWTTGDPNRVSASNITYDTNLNIIHVKATGNNNVALMMKYNENDYTIDKDETFLVVRGSNLRTTSGSSYLWWLNGSNHGTQVAPSATQTIDVDDQQQVVVAWNMATSGIYENFSGNRPSICVGQTIFGLTSTTGESDIYDINFVKNVNDYIAATTDIQALSIAAPSSSVTYDLSGRPVTKVKKGLYIRNNTKVVTR